MSESNSIVGSVAEAVKDRLTNRLYIYMFSSLVAANWQHILIILKSKNDIELTLGIMAFENHLFILYFLLPLIVGAVLALFMPYCTRIVSEYTASQYYLIKNSDKVGQTALELKLATEKEKISEKERKKAKSDLETTNFKNQLDIFESQSKAYYKWLSGLLKAYKETGGKIETTDDLKKILLKLKEHNAVYDIEIVPEFEKMMANLEKMDEHPKKEP
ncbi:TPA: hypothetical protein ACQ7SR_002861 [Klebsiella pneumoniae]|uniref:hypothetical protein n=1 Tax=Klebsiella pneumoniae TaxID=573 RepID=UPI000D64814F|nr:hypothetical protein [Klebsiella pneumoniae]HCA9770843.1 hypothetical protein [Klebsiella variicola subsp. variicola]HBR5116498.1 hypothetical protein [Klebsiella pneumoniae]HBT5588655.1 hypothetical protein [Klebsiella pneumoniae]HEC0101384.1 hypothetical protein [Klebsiella pneumoniae]HEC1378071.1 hypothetical protein [Klebsiella pneumoniae]